MFGGASAALAILTLVLPFGLFVGALYSSDPNDPKNQGWGALGVLIAGMAAGILAAAVCGLAGTVAGIVALSRGERRQWLAIVGLLVNGIVVLLLAAAIVSNANGG